MNLSNLFANIHWIPVIVTTILSFALGAVWHQKFLFGKTWTEENKPTLENKKMNAPLIFGGTAVMHLLALAGLSALVTGQGWHGGLHTGFLISVVFILPAMAATYLFSNRSLKLLAIDTGMYIVLFSLAGGILGSW
jgi:hypothetical protein